MKAKKSGIFYGARKLASGGWGIIVAVYKKGKWIESDHNRMAWPSEKVALERAKGSAEALENNSAEYKGLPVLSAAGEKWLALALAE